MRRMYQISLIIVGLILITIIAVISVIPVVKMTDNSTDNSSESNINDTVDSDIVDNNASDNSVPDEYDNSSYEYNNTAVYYVPVYNEIDGEKPAKLKVDIKFFGNDIYVYDINDNGQMVGEIRDIVFYDYINDNGQMAGGSFQKQQAFLWQKGKIRFLGNENGSFFAANAINNIGQIIGEGLINGVDYGMLWQKGSTKYIGSMFPRDINDKGQIVGNDLSNDYHAFLWQNGKIKDLGTLGGNTSVARAINNKGQIVGWSDTPNSSFLGEEDERGHAFLWEDGKMKDLGTLGGNSSGANEINDNGQIVGNSQISSGEHHAFLYENGKMKDLGTLRGKTESYTYSINNKGQIVGESLNSYDLSPHPFLWEKGKMIDLYNPKFNNTDYISINNKGQITTIQRR